MARTLQKTPGRRGLRPEVEGVRRRHQGGLTLIAVPSLDRWTENQRMKDKGSRMPAAANRLAGAPDNFMRRRFMASAAPRNL